MIYIKYLTYLSYIGDLIHEISSKFYILSSSEDSLVND